MARNTLKKIKWLRELKMYTKTVAQKTKGCNRHMEKKRERKEKKTTSLTSTHSTHYLKLQQHSICTFTCTAPAHDMHMHLHMHSNTTYSNRALAITGQKARCRQA